MYKRVLDISCISLYESALINATWLSLTSEDFQCAKIESFYEKRSDAEIAIKMRRITQGCGVISDRVRVEVNNIQYHSCLCHDNFQYPAIGYLIQLRQNYENGILPFAGGVLEQPAQVMEMIQLMVQLQQEWELAQSKKEK